MGHVRENDAARGGAGLFWPLIFSLPDMAPPPVLAAIAIVAALAYSWRSHGTRGLKSVRAVHDGREYRVRDRADAQLASDTLAEIVRRCLALIDRLRAEAPDDPRTARVAERFNPDVVSELAEDEEGTSYSIDKGAQLVFCVRSKESGAIERMNTLMYVAVHELAHLAVPANVIGHPPEFWATFKWLLDHAVKAGVYTFEDYGEKEESYCGIEITSNVLAASA